MIRALRETDMDRMMEIWLDTNIRAHDFIPRQYWEDHQELVRALLPQAEVLVCEDQDGGLLGFCGLSGRYLEGLFVRYGEQSRGVGRELLEAAKAGRECLTLHVYRKNTRAIAFYLRQGFAVQEERVDENTGEIELHMIWECFPGTEKQ